MTLSKGDHLVIKRGDKVLEGSDESYHEFEVTNDGPNYIQYVNPEPDDEDTRTIVKNVQLRVVE